jgi:hypothetical protein
MTDLQRLCLYALEDMTLTELNDKYFDGGIGWTKRMIAGSVYPMPVMAKIYEKRFQKKYHKKVIAHRKVIELIKNGW